MDMTFSGRVWATVSSLPGYLHSSRAATSAGLSLRTTLQMSLTNCLNRSLLAQKSVSQLTSTMAATPHSGQTRA